MSKMKRFALSGHLLAGLGMVFMGLASASAEDKKGPVKLTANTPGNIRTETCARPEYPEQSLKQDHHGAVTLRFLLSKDGIVKRSLVQTSSGYPALDEAALVAISRCRFNPAMVDGKAVEAWTAVQYVWKP